MDATRIVVGAKLWPQPPHLARREYIQRRAVIQLVAGLALTGFAAALLWNFFIHGNSTWSVFACAFLVLGLVVVVANVYTLSRLSYLPDDRRVPITLPYAFAVEGDEVVFPEFTTHPEERWPVRETSASAAKVLDMVTLRCPGRRTRRFFAMAISVSTIEAAQLVNDRRDAALAAAEGPDPA